jgi:hypothetical protein
VVPAKLDAIAGPAAAASSAKDNETERSFMRVPKRRRQDVAIGTD